MLGKAAGGRKQPVFWRRPPDRPGNPPQDNPDLAVRDGKWKLCINHDLAAPQLYDLENDPAEERNIAEGHPEVVARLQQAVLDWNATLPADAGDPRFRPEPKPATTPGPDEARKFPGRGAGSCHRAMPADPRPDEARPRRTSARCSCADADPPCPAPEDVVYRQLVQGGSGARACRFPVSSEQPPVVELAVHTGKETFRHGHPTNLQHH